ncbi:MAG: hypothetical protein SGJ02_04660 [bacterium]|nr:hypothetical protein [bacterium]
MRRTLFVCLTSFIFFGCSVFTTTLKPVAKRVVVNSNKEIILGYKEEAPPFQIQILEEKNLGDEIRVKLRLTAHVPWPSDNIVILLSSLKGESVVSKVQNCIFDDCIPKKDQKIEILPAFVPKDITLSVPAEEVSDYRVEVIWGAEATEFKQQLALQLQDNVAPELSLITIDKKVSNCSLAECHVAYTVKAILTNTSTRTIKEVILGAGFFILNSSEKPNKVPQIPKNEEKIPLQDLYLAPNSSKTIEVIVEQDVPRSVERLLKPSIRILSHEFGTK